jgi:hypothetical protein
VKHSKLLPASILIAFAILLSGSSLPLKPPTIQGHDSQAHDPNGANDRNPPEVVQSSSFEAQILESLRAIIRQQQTARTEDQANEKRWWPPSPSWAIVYVTFVYVVIAIFQWQAIRRQADVAERALTRDKLPYVFVKEPHATYLSLFDGRKADIEYTLKNYGNGPAFFRAVIGHSIVSEKLGPIPHARPLEPSTPKGWFVLGAGEETPPLDAAASSATISDEEWQSLGREPTAKFKVFFYGLVNYTDIWDDEWTNGFAWIYDPKLQAMRVATKYEVPEGYNYQRKEPKTKERFSVLRTIIGSRRPRNKSP